MKWNNYTIEVKMSVGDGTDDCFWILENDNLELENNTKNTKEALHMLSYFHRLRDLAIGFVYTFNQLPPVGMEFNDSQYDPSKVTELEYFSDKIVIVLGDV